MGQRLSSAIRDDDTGYRLILMGLDGSGKTQILYRLKTNTVVQTMPTIGFNVETLQFKGTIMTAWDVGIRGPMSKLIKHYTPGMDALIFVVDSSDPQRLEQAKDFFQWTLEDENLRDIPILLFCNKQDQKTAWPAQDVAREMGLLYSNFVFHEVGCSAITGEGLEEGMEWLAKTLQTRPSRKASAVPYKQEFALTASRQKVILDYDPTLAGGNLTLRRFATIQLGTDCPFAKSAMLWGGKMLEEDDKDNDKDVSLEEQAKINVDALIVFAERVAQGERLDGFCIEINDEKARQGGPQDLGECVRHWLTALSDLDPAKQFIMRKNYIGARGWRFRFAKEDFFVTTFAPCYPITSSRYAFECGRAFVLFQPETSFLRHNLPPDTEVTNWDHPKTIRDKARVAYRKAGRGYHTSPKDPMAHHVVKPLVDDGESFVHWWKQYPQTDVSKHKKVESRRIS